MSITYSFFIISSIVLLLFSLFSLLLNSHFFNIVQATNQSILNIYISNKTIIPENKQTINVKFNNISNQQDYMNMTTINGKIIYLSNVAQVFTGNITNNGEYSYSWIIDPRIQDSGIVLVEVDLLLNNSKIQSNTTSFNIVNINR
ncbi:MAG: hypothetical protein ACPKQO_08850 [Nitrososphaeraceae archaeon]